MVGSGGRISVRNRIRKHSVEPQTRIEWNGYHAIRSLADHPGSRLAPRIVKVKVVPTSAGFDVQLTGYATTREVTQGTFRFSGAASASPIVVTVPLSSTSAAWFQSTTSDKFGGQFGLVQSFTWQGQPASGLNAISVSLTNAQGASAEMQAQF